MSLKNIIIAGGGTGGHIYPAIAIARALEQQDQDIKIHFVGTRQGLETKIVPREKLPLHFVSIGKLNYAGGFLGKLKTLALLPVAFVQSLNLLFKLQPQFVLGVGGYASGPVVAVASLLGFRTAIWEPNAHPGLTNRWLSRFVGTSFVVFDEAAKLLKSKNIVKVGLPIRESLETVKQQPHQGFNILLFGGSQGARALNNALAEAVTQDATWLQDTKLIHQTGSLDFSRIHKLYEPFRAMIEPAEFIYDMDAKYAWADLVICRAGASTVAELAACGVPAILVPLPTAADDHQKKNALAIEKVGGGVLLEQRDLNAQKLKELILDLRSNPTRLANMRINIHKIHTPQAAQKVAVSIIQTWKS